jgi:uncharacterized membrane protein YvbJ
MKCPRCGKDNIETRLYCDNCKTELKQTPSLTREQIKENIRTYDKMVKADKGMQRAKIIFWIIVLLFVMGVVSLFRYNANAPKYKPYMDYKDATKEQWNEFQQWNDKQNQDKRNNEKMFK